MTPNGRGNTQRRCELKTFHSSVSNGVERALYSEPMFALALAHTDSERRVAHCYAPVPLSV